MSKNPETIVEEYLSREVAKLGGQSYKWNPPRGVDGVPDRIILYNNKTFFVEVKTTKGALRPSQVNLFPVIAKVHDLHIVYGKAGVQQFIEEELSKWHVESLNQKMSEKICTVLNALVKACTNLVTGQVADESDMHVSIQAANIELHNPCTPSLKFYPNSKRTQLRERKGSS